ncbi:glycosyltransferase family 9 protein [Segatella maculosa]|uniref:glycosyltransferase family 9 protein n=1 Tax=Segatella maculosa TaxID=439703 RepID=UPI0024911E91|nr:glycosyltransferase family 9 protein [Segatella maculosa]
MKHLLIIRFSAMGDVAMMLPVVASLARQYPDLRVTVLSKPFARPFFEGLDNVRFMAADIKNEYQGFNGLNALYRRLLAKNFTDVADFHDVLRTKYLRLRFFLGGFRVAHIDKHRKGKRLLCRKKDKVKVQQPTSFENYAAVLARLGYPVKLDFQSVFPAERGNLRRLPAVIGEKKEFQRWIGIAPFAAHKGKIYPLEKMEKVVEKLIQLYPSCRIFLFGGGEKEREVLDVWAKNYVNCMNASALLNGIGDELILMSHLDVMLSMDSGNMHLASLVGTRVVSVWGATHPFAGFMGWNQRKTDAVQLDMPCRPCSVYGNKPCFRGDYACMNGIDYEQIVAHVQRIFN